MHHRLRIPMVQLHVAAKSSVLALVMAAVVVGSQCKLGTPGLATDYLAHV